MATGTTRKPRRKNKPQFKPIPQIPGRKAILPPQYQEVVHDFILDLTPEQRDGVILFANLVMSGPLLREGYGKTFRFLREYLPTLTQITF